MNNKIYIIIIFFKYNIKINNNNNIFIYILITLLRVIPTMTCWVGVVRLWLSSSFIPWTKRKTSNGVEKVRWKRANILKAASPASFFSGFLHDLVVSCLLLRIAPVRSVQINRSQPLPKHVSIPPGRNKHAKICHNKHAKSCQDTTCQK